MNNHVWFRLLVRALGLFLAISGIPTLWEQLIKPLYYLYAMGQQSDILSWLLLNILGVVAQFGLGLYLLMGGGLVFRYCLRDVDRRCARCGYDVGGNTSAVCPECGLILRATPETDPKSSVNAEPSNPPANP